MKFVLQHVIEQGPYDAVYGFSQGAGIAALLSCEEIRKKLIQDMIGDSNNRGTDGSDSPWKFIFATCATFPVPLQDITNYIGIETIPFPISVPSVHLIGIEDPFKGRSEFFFDCFTDRDKGLSLVVYFEGGHEVSGDPKNLKRAAFTAADWFSKHNLNHGFVFANNESDHSLLRAVTEEIDELTSRQSGSSSIGGKVGQYQLKTVDNFDEDVNLAALLKRNEIEDQIAFRAPGRKPITFGALWKFVRDEGNLSTVGCKYGDKVAYLAPFGVLGAVAFTAIAVQCQAIPLDPESSSTNIDDAFRQLCPDVFVIFDDLGVDVCAQAEACAAKLDIRVIRASGNDKELPFVFVERKVHDSAEDSFFENKGKDTCLLLRTSGTTSQPKVSDSLSVCSSAS
jgi:hypothetical protein